MKSTGRERITGRAFVHIGRDGLEIHAGIAGALCTRLEPLGRVRGSLSPDSLGAAVRAALDRSRPDPSPASVRPPSEVLAEIEVHDALRSSPLPPTPESLAGGALWVERGPASIVIGMMITDGSGFRRPKRSIVVGESATDRALGRALRRAITLTRLGSWWLRAWYRLLSAHSRQR